MRLPDWQTDDGCVQLHLCDARELLLSLPDGHVDVTVTSPPYNTLPKDTKAYGFRRRKGSRIRENSGGQQPDFSRSRLRCGEDGWLKKVSSAGYDDRLPEDRYQVWLTWMISEMSRVSRGLVWINHKLRFRNGRGIHPLRWLPFDLWSEIIWDRRGSMALNCGKHAPSHEYLFAFGRPHWWDDSQNKLLSVWQIPPERGCEEHPCPWPVEIPRRLIAASCPPDGLVLDPFMGRGTTALACLRLGRRFIGCDRSAAYFAAAKRLVTSALASGSAAVA
ncbi:MAG: DNA-methyltransferase [Pirellulales bacterium]